ncbi:MAG: peptidylprolyl isomerase [Acidimicrobiales bacterium]
MRRLLPLVAAAVALVTLAACGSVRSYAAKVNGRTISQHDLESELEAILANEGYLKQVDENFQGEAGEGAVGAGRRTFTTAFVAALLDRRIGFELIDQELRRRRLTVTAADRTEATSGLDESFGADVVKDFPKSYRTALVEDFAKVAVLERALAGAGVTDAAVRQFYEANAAAFRGQSCSRHILVATLEAATAIRSRLDAGEDFAAIARAESTDRNGPAGGSAGQGGDLGCQARNTFVPEFQSALDALTPGQVSPPVQTQFGFHVIQLVERKDTTLAEAAPDIRRQLEQQAGAGGAVGRFVNEAVGKADIEVNPRYGSFDKGDSPGVKPPPPVGGPAATPAPAPLPIPLPSPSP